MEDKILEIGLFLTKENKKALHKKTIKVNLKTGNVFVEETGRMVSEERMRDFYNDDPRNVVEIEIQPKTKKISYNDIYREVTELFISGMSTLQLIEKYGEIAEVVLEDFKNSKIK